MPKPLFSAAAQQTQTQVKSPDLTFQPMSFQPNQNAVQAAVQNVNSSIVKPQTSFKIDIRKPDQVASYGADVQASVAKFADEILEQVKTSSVDSVGPKLVQIVTVAKELNVSDLNGTSSKVPIFGKLIDSFSKRRAKFVSKFNSLKDQIDTIVKEIDTTAENLLKRNKTLEGLYQHNIVEYKKLEELINFGKQHLTEQVQTFESQKAEAVTSGRMADPMVAQEFSDWEAAIKRFEKQISYLEATQMMAVHSMPEIRIIQRNNETLVEKFNAAKTHTIPAWKKQFILAVALEEQQKAGNLATTIDDATNAFYKQNADLLKQNAVTVAKANERNIIDLETLEYMQTSLISTFDEMRSIEEEGAKNRVEFSNRVATMKQELYQKVVTQK